MVRAGVSFMLAAVFLVGCTKSETPLEKAEHNYEFVKAHGTISDLCTAADQGKAAAIEAHDNLAYQTWESRSIQHCRLEMR